MDVSVWLRGLGLSQYEQAFRDNDIDAGVLPELTAEDLVGLGVASIGHRRKLLAAIAQLEAMAPSTTPLSAHLPPRPVVEAERRHLTVMFIDLVESTALSARLDPEEMRDIILAYQTTVSGIVTRFDGNVAKFMGDGVLCYFGWPNAHEEDPERAVRAGLAVVEAVSHQRLTDGTALAARVGIATGVVVVGDLIGSGTAQEEAVVGETPNLAARLQGVAKPGRVVIAERTRRLIDDVFVLDDLGPQSLKGLGDDIGAFQVVAERSAENRFEARAAGRLTAMVGRDEELALLLERWKQATSGEGQFVLLLGEAGIGKSRVVRAVVDAIAAQPHVRISFQCSPYHAASALYPAIQQLTFAARFSPTDSNEDKLDKLERIVLGPRESLPLFADLLGVDFVERYGALDMPSSLRRARTLDAMLTQLILVSEANPVLFVIEDIHWIDATTLELIAISLDRIATKRVMTLATARSGSQFSFGGHCVVTKLTLNRLGRDQILAIVRKLTRGKALPPIVVDEIIARTDGVPLYVEEFTKTVLEVGELQETATSYELTGPDCNLSIPASLHDSLTARLDRLQPIKEVAQTAACIGREFDYRLLAAVLPLNNAKLESALSRLTEADLVFRRGVPPEARYVFKHALVRDAAYESLLNSRRQAIHHRLFQALESQHATAPEILAHHAAMAGMTKVAADYWTSAGRNATERSANLEAIRHLTRAVEAILLLPETPHRDRSELAAQSALGTALTSVHGYAASETGAAFGRARILSKRLGDRSGVYATLGGEFAYHFVRGDPMMMRKLTAEALATAEECEDPALAMLAQRFLGQCSIHFGEFDRAKTALDNIVRVYSAAEHRPARVHYVHDPKIYALAYLAPVRWIQGHADEAKSWSAATVDYAHELNHANMSVFGQVYGCAGLYELLNDADAVKRHVDSILALSEKHSLLYFRLSGLILKGWVMARAGRIADGIALMRGTIDERRSLGASWYQSRYLCMLAELYFAAHDSEAGLATITEARDQMVAHDEHTWEAELRRVEGELLALAGAPPEAVQVCLIDAVAISQRQGARAFELRAISSLARHSCSASRAEQANRLQDVLADFTEGRDTPDYRAAQAIVRNLRDNDNSPLGR